MTDTSTLERALCDAIERRMPLVRRLASDETDCYRLLHGSQEGAPGVTLDRYGDLALLQSFHQPIPDQALTDVRQVLEQAHPELALVYNDRSGPGSRVRNQLSEIQQKIAETSRIVCEHGVRFRIKARHRGNDPWLFLDMRTTRRAIMEEANGKSMLNLFSYTCGAGVAAAVAGATRVLNVDFATSSLAVGRSNAELNSVAKATTELRSDVFPALRQLAGIRQAPVDRGRRLPPFPHVKREQFDLVLLDPPPRAKSPFGVVDLVRDYQSLLKPALACVAEGGALYCTNNVADVEESAWHEVLRNCAQKHGRPIRQLDVVRPDEDFPSSDRRPPLKSARITL